MRKADIASLVPHAGGMCLLDEVLSWNDAGIRCRTTSHRDLHNPMRIGAALPALCGIEYAAQAMAVHGRLTLQEKTPKAGYLASVRDVICHADRLDDIAEDLVIDAELLVANGANVLYRFSISSSRGPILEGRAAVVIAA